MWATAMSENSKVVTARRIHPSRRKAAVAVLGGGAALAIGLAAPAGADTASPDEGSGATHSTQSPRGSATRSGRSTEATAGSRSVSARQVTRTPSTSPRRGGSETAPRPATAPAAWTLLGAVGREIERTFFNRYPTIAPVTAAPTAEGVVTGTMGATDADGDRLVYTVVAEPSLGRVDLDSDTGNFTYTPVVDFAAYGGEDSFTVAVSDETNFHIHGLQGLLNAPIAFVRSIPFLGSLLSDYLPSTTPTATVRLSFDGTGSLAALEFPEGFRWGVSTAAFQAEMGGDAPLDTNSDWWQWTHDPLNSLLLGWRGAVPEDGPGQYNLYPTDIDLARNEVGANTFRISIEWSRIFPTTTASVDAAGGITPEVLSQLDALADQDAVTHYRDEIAAMRAAGLDPMVTVNHFTLPLWIHDPAAARATAFLGGTPETAAGWVSESTATEFEKYSAYLAWKLGPQVGTWLVLNEPVTSMLVSYYAIPLATNFPPAVFRPDLVARGLRNQATAYAAAYDAIHEFDPDAQVGFALNMYSWRPANPANPVDQQATASFSDFYNRWFPDAVLLGRIDANFDGVISDDEIRPELADKADFFGVNYYSQGIVASYGGASDPALPIVKGYPQFSPLLNVVAGGCPARECTDTAQIINPAGLRSVLDIANSYGLPLWVTENGLADADDDQRPSYVVRHLAVLHQAIADGMDIRGYTAWALTDNLEWVLGYEPKFGLYSYDPVTLARTPRPSVGLVRDIFTGNALTADAFRAYTTSD